MTDTAVPEPSLADAAVTKRLSLAEIRSSSHTSLPRRSYSLCLAGSVMAEIRTLAIELEQVRVEDEIRHAAEKAARRPDPELVEPAGGIARLGQGAPEPEESAPPSARAVELRGQIRQRREVMDSHTGELVVQGEHPDAWASFIAENAPREKNQRDVVIGLSVCNADALLARLGDFAHSWNGDPIEAGDWDYLRSKSSPGDLNEIAKLVITMHEQVVDLGKLRSDLLATLSSESD